MPATAVLGTVLPQSPRPTNPYLSSPGSPLAQPYIPGFSGYMGNAPAQYSPAATAGATQGGAVIPGGGGGALPAGVVPADVMQMLQTATGQLDSRLSADAAFPDLANLIQSGSFFVLSSSCYFSLFFFSS